MLKQSIWLVFVFMSVLIFLSSAFFKAFPEITFDISIEYPGSNFRWEDLDYAIKLGRAFSSGDRFGM